MRKSTESQIMISLIPQYFNETLKRLIAGSMALLTIVAACLPAQQVIAYTYDTVEATESAEAESVDYATTEDSDFDASKVGIVAEVEDLRTIDTKTFLKEDGTYVTAVYAEPVHYLVNDNYEDIDNTLSFDAESGVYSTKANAFGVQFPDSLDGDQTIRVTYEDYSIAWALTDVAKSTVSVAETATASEDPKVLTKVNQSVSYASVLEGVDVDYTVTGTSVKENFILDRYVADFSLSFTYSLENLTLALQDDWTYAFVDEGGKAVFAFDTLYMYDGEGNDSQNIKLSVTESEKGEYVVTVTPDSEWLKTAAYPVTIDPTISSATTAMSFQDTYVNQAAPDTQTYYNTTYFYVAYGTGIVNQKRGLLSFVLPSLAGKKMTYAHLTLTKADTNTVARVIELHQNTSGFSESTVTWNTAPSYETEVVDYTIVQTIAGFEYVFDITASCREWAEGISTNYGFTIMDQEEIGNYTRFYSSEHATLMPVVEIGYIDPAGLKDYWTYSSQDCGAAGMGYVSDYTGLLSWSRTDFSFATEKQTLGLSFFFDITQKTSNIGYGLGWKTNYSVKVGFDSALGLYYSIDGSGSKVYYHSISAAEAGESTRPMFLDSAYQNYYLAEDGSRNILCISYSDSAKTTVTQQKIWTSEEVSYVFGTDAYLDQITDTATTLDITISRNSTYKDRIEQITDDTGNKIVLTYVSGRVSTAVLSLYESGATYISTQRATYGYTYNSTIGGYSLSSVAYQVDLDGNAGVTAWVNRDYVSYSYSLPGQLTSGRTYTIDESSNQLNAEKTQYTYDGSGRVATIETFYDSAQYSDYTFAYALKTTTIRETMDTEKFIIYKFDDFGHTVTMLDSFGTTQSFRYLNLFSAYDEEQEAFYQLIDGGPNYYLNHVKIIESSPTSTLLNPVINHGFEYDFGGSGDAWSLYSSGGVSEYFLSADEYVFGNRSGLLTHSGVGTAYISEDFLLDGNPYTLSGYVKNETDSDQVCIDILNESYGGATTSVPNDGEWHYVEVLFGVTTNDWRVYVHLINNEEGNVYFDNIQVVQGFTDTRKNLVDNPSFEYVNVNTQTLPEWVFSDAVNVERVNISAGLPEVYGSILGDYGIQIVGNALENRNASIALAGIVDVGDSDGMLVVGAWAQSNGTPVYESGENLESRYFRIRVDGKDSSGVLVQSHYLDFDASIEGWQYLCGEMEIDSTEVTFTLYLEYRGEGSVVFDGLQIYYEPLNTRYSYSDVGQLTQISGPNKNITMTYEDGSVSSTPSTITDMASGAIVGIEPGEGLVEEVVVSNVASTPTYNSYGQVTSLTVGDSENDHFTTSTAYLSSGFSQYLSSTTDEYGEVTRYYSDLLTGLSEAIENAKGQDTHYIYDEKGRLIEIRSVEDYTSALSDTDARVVYQYDDRDRLTTIILGWSGSTATYYYAISYDAEGRMSSVSVNDMTLMTYTYKDDGTFETGNIETQTYANGDAIKFLYDDQDRVSDVQFSADGSGIFSTRFAYEYDQDGRIAVYRAYEEATLVTTEYYTYDSAGNLVGISDGEGNEINYSYDESGNLTGLHFVLGGSESTAAYFYNQILSEETTSLYDYTTLIPQSGVTYTKEYNYEAGALRRLESISLLSGSGTIFEQEFAFLDDTVRITDIRYDLLGDGLILYTYSYLYDELGNITLVTYFEGAILKTQNYYEYDEFNQLIIEDVFIWGGTSNTFVYEYDLRGNRVASIKYPFGYRTGGVTYDPATLTNTGTISVTPYINGQIYSEPVIVDIGDAFPSISFSFIDEDGYSYSIVPNDGTTNFINYRKGFYYQNYWAYVYMGNQTINCHFSIVLNVGDVETDPGVSIMEYQFEYSEEWLDQLESYDIIIDESIIFSNDYVYDDQGNPVSISNFEYERNAVLVWDGRQLTEIQLYNTSNVWQKTISYRYNDQGYRIQKTTETSTGTTIIDYTLSGDKVLRETDGIWEMVYAYDYDGTLIGFNYDANIADSTEGLDYFYLFNQQGDVTGIVNSSGTPVLKYRYDAFGTRTIASYTTEGYKFITKNPYTYRGYRYDTDTGLYYLNSRYYDPEIGRFLNSDGMLGETGDILSTNMYAYCANNPVMATDATGYSSSWWKGALVVLCCVAVIAVAVAVVCLAPGPGTILATMAITYAAGVVMNEIEVASLQYSKSKSEGDDSAEIFNDICDSTFNNMPQIFLGKAFGKIGAYGSGIYNLADFSMVMEAYSLEANSIAKFWNMGQYCVYSVGERFSTGYAPEYLKTTTTSLGFIVGYGCLAVFDGIPLAYALATGEQLDAWPWKRNWKLQ